jgi:hypothetical protein
VDRAHVSVDRPGALDPPWTDAGADNGHGDAQNGEGGTGSSSRASLGLERRRGGWVTTGKARWCRRSVRGRLELKEREMRAGKGAVKLKEVARLL